MKGVPGWLFQRLTGILLFAGLITHFYVMHFSGHEKVRYETVMHRLSNPYWVLFDLVFLSCAIYHGFNGLHGIVLEYVRSAKLLRFFQTLILTLSSLFIAVGIYIITL